MNTKSFGYAYLLAAIVIFAGQDAFSKVLGDRYPAIMIVMVRYWVFALFVIALAASSPGGLKRALRTKKPTLQIFRGLLLVSEIVIVIISFTTAGLALSQAVFQVTPLFVTILSVPLLGEKVGWRRSLAVLAGLSGVLIVLNPLGVGFDWYLLIPLGGAFMYAIYSIATRAVSQHDSAATSVLYLGVIGAIAASLIGPFFWMPIVPDDWPAMIALCLCGCFSHFFLIKAYGFLKAVEVQPLTYLQLVLSVGIAHVFFDEAITTNMVIGSVIVVVAGLFTAWREHRLGQKIAIT